MIAFAGHNGDTPPAMTLPQRSAADLSEETRAAAIDACSRPYVEYLRAGISVECCASCGRSKPSRTAVNEFGRLLREAGRARDVMNELERMVGARLDVARESVQAVQRARTVTDEDRARVALQVLDEYCRARGLSIETARASLAVVS